MRPTITRITPFLWFDHQAVDAARFYTGIFKNSKVIRISPISVSFQLDGQRFFAFNGGPHFKFNEAVSFFVSCQTQREIDYYWEKLSAGGRKSQCGWLKDKFGLSWQVVPPVLLDLLEDADHASHVEDGQT